MRRQRSWGREPRPAWALVMVLAGVGVLWARPAHAYIDAGTGGLLVQMLLAGVAGAAVLTRMYWQKLKALIVRREK